MTLRPAVSLLLLLAGLCTTGLAQNITDAKLQHAAIGVDDTIAAGGTPHSHHPDAQWFPEAGFGLFIHWGLSSVFDAKGKRVGDLSWPMIAGAWKKNVVTDPVEQARIVREGDWNFDGKPPVITPNDYWEAIKDFNPQKYDPDKWVAAAKAAGFTYVVLTTRHHEGFALWPSAYGDFNTSNHMGGRDLVKPFIEACRKYGLKVGLYYSPPDWHFNRAFENFMYYATAAKNPWMPALDGDLKPRTAAPTAEQKEKQIESYNVMVKGQVEELLTRYGKIDLLWFDGSIPAPARASAPRLTQERILALQPGIVLSPRYFRKGDFVTFEGPVLKTDQKPNGWAEWCTTWTQGWAYNSKDPFYANGFVLASLAKARSLDINYLLDVGPDADGELHPDAYKNMAVVAGWMRQNRAAVIGAGALPAGEAADGPATAAGNMRYLFAVPQYKKAERALDADMLPLQDAVLTLRGLAAAPQSVKLLGDGLPVAYTYQEGSLTVRLPAARRTNLPAVVAVALAR